MVAHRVWIEMILASVSEYESGVFLRGNPDCMPDCEIRPRIQ